MKLRKVLTAAVLTAVTACSLLLTGCQQKLVPADQVATALYDLAVKDDAVPMKDLLGFASEEDVRKSLIEGGESTDFVDEFKQEFTNAGIDFTDEEIQEMTDQLMGLLTRMTCTAEITEQSGKETTVVLKVKGYTYAEVEKITTELQEKALTEVDEETQMALATGDEEATMKFMQQFMKDYVAAVSAMEPTEESEITIKMEKMKVDVSGKTKLSWMPVDMPKMESDLDTAMMK